LSKEKPTAATDKPTTRIFYKQDLPKSLQRHRIFLKLVSPKIVGGLIPSTTTAAQRWFNLIYGQLGSSIPPTEPVEQVPQRKPAEETSSIHLVYNQNCEIK